MFPRKPEIFEESAAIENGKRFVETETRVLQLSVEILLQRSDHADRRVFLQERVKCFHGARRHNDIRVDEKNILPRAFRSTMRVSSSVAPSATSTSTVPSLPTVFLIAFKHILSISGFL